MHIALSYFYFRVVSSTSPIVPSEPPRFVSLPQKSCVGVLGPAERAPHARTCNSGQSASDSAHTLGTLIGAIGPRSETLRLTDS